MMLSLCLMLWTIRCVAALPSLQITIQLVNQVDSKARVQTFSHQIIEYAIACIPPTPSPFVNYLRNEITMTTPMSPGIQCPCFLPFDPPHRCSTLHELNSPLPPSTFIKLPPHIIPPRLQLSTFPPSNEIKMLPPSNEMQMFPPYNNPLPLPTMLINSAFILIPPSSSVFPLALSLFRI